MRNLSLLVGNGLSIAYNEDLHLTAITEELIRRIAADDGGVEVVRALNEIAARALPDGATTDEDFEVLVGALGSEGRALDHLRDLAELTLPADTELKDAIGRVTGFAERVRDVGVSHVLEIIFERSRLSHGDADELFALLRTLSTAFEGRLTFANLNYDTILLAALLTVEGALADLAHGYLTSSIEIDGVEHQVPALRTTDDLPDNRRIRLLHLHGSLTYWRNAEGAGHVKLVTQFLDDHALWQAVRDESTTARPVVVLSTQRDKHDHVRTYPFSLAYEIFGASLDDTDHWLIIGYSFKDACVNEMLRRAFLAREEKPRVLVSTFGDAPSRSQVEEALGWGAEDGASAPWLSFSRDGAFALPASTEWAEFATP